MKTQQPAIEPILITKNVSARALGVCVRTVENLIASKQLPARKIGRRTLIPYRALLEFAKRDHATQTIGAYSARTVARSPAKHAGGAGKVHEEVG